MKKTNQTKSNQMYFVNVANVIEKLQDCNQKEKSTNDKIISMLENSNLEKVKIEISKNGSFNRGSLVECLVKSAILNYLYIDNSKIAKSQKGENDLNLSKRSKDLLKELGLENQNYEIKLLTSLARASRINDLNACKKVLMVDLRNKSCGCYVVDKENLILYTNCKPNENAYNSIKDYKNGIELETLSEILGLRD